MKRMELVLNPREIRRHRGLKQQHFWAQIGVTQSGGSRYENGRSMPKPVQELLRLVHVEGIDLSKLSRQDFDVLEFLKTQHSDLYESLCRKVPIRRGKKGIKL